MVVSKLKARSSHRHEGGNMPSRRWSCHLSAAASLAVMMTLAGAGPARAERAPADWAQAAQTAPVLLGRLQPGATLDSFQESLRSEFVLLDADADGRINARDVELHALMEAVQTRTQGGELRAALRSRR
jgi:hypothetical protein